MKAGKIVWIAGLSIALFLGACNSAGGNAKGQSEAGQMPASGQESGQVQAGQDADGKGTDGQSADRQAEGQQAAMERIVNNGTYFVKKGDEILFAAGTSLCRYNEQTGEVTEIGVIEKNDYDDADSKLFYSDGWIYYGHYDTDRQDTWVFRIDEETGAKEAVCQGYLEGISEDSRYLFLNRYEDSSAFLVIYEGNRQVAELRVKDNGDAIYCGTSGDYVFVQNSIYEGDTPDHQILATKISQPDAFSLVGHMPCLNEDGYWYEYPDVTQVLVNGEKAYFSLSYYAGTGMFYNGGYVCEADLTKEDSLQIIKTSDAVGLEDEGMQYGEVYLWLQNGVLQMGQALPNTARYSGEYGGSGILMYDENGRENLFYPGLVPPSDQETFLSEELQNVYRIDGVCYFVWKRLLNDPSQAIGWRSYYETVNTEYDRIDQDGTLTVMREEAGNLVLTGYIARGADDSYVYFQPVDQYEDYEGTQMETLSDTIAKVYLAEEHVVSDWGEFLYGVDTFADSDVEFNGYQGYYVGDAPISEQRFLIRFDKDGKVTQIAPDYAD